MNRARGGAPKLPFSLGTAVTSDIPAPNSDGGASRNADLSAANEGIQGKHQVKRIQGAAALLTDIL
jgi:hypothetical protein